MGVTVVIVTHDRSLARKVDRYVSIHDGRTSQEAVRKDGPGAIQVGGAVPSPIGQRAAADPESHEHYLLLDSAGRLRLPREILERKGIRRRVKLVEEEGRILILPPETKE
jgi:energy-coupling factor transporter ATP-binding protein EcfA2